MTDLEVAKRYLEKAQSSADRKIPFELSFRRYRQLLLQKTCFYTGKPFEKLGANSRTLDRKDNDIGYTDKNTVACLRYLNNAKNNLSINDILKLAKKLKPEK